jgi:hypothetical protein
MSKDLEFFAKAIIKRNTIRLSENINQITGERYIPEPVITTLHSVDYFLQNKGEAPVVKKNILHFDEEIYTGKNKVFPDPAASLFPINAILDIHVSSGNPTE